MPPARAASVPPLLPHLISPSPAMLSNSTDRRLAWLALSLLPGVGPAARRLPPRVQQGLSLYRQGDPRIDRHIEQSRAWLQQADCHLLTIDDPHYPPLLREISDPPLVLFVQGSAQLLSDPQIAMVGTRHPGPHGASTARAFARDFTENGLTVTSGMALGIDGACHQGALDAHGQTIAVWGTGLANCYPRRHRQD